MMPKNWRPFLLVGTILLGMLATTQPGTAQTSPITFTESRVENYFPEGLTFRGAATSTAGDIVSGKLIYKFRNDTSATQAVLDITPAPTAALRYAWDTSAVTIPPSAPIFYHWEVIDSEGNRGVSEEKIFYYDDVRFDWQIREGDGFAVWWHDQPDELGDNVFSVSEKALTAQRSLFQAELDFPIRIIIYNDDDEFAEWHSFVSEFVGGQAFPNLGITTQIVPPDTFQQVWINDVIPHEISHLFFYQATYSPFNSPPAWLNEGIAQRNEFSTDRMREARTREVIRAGGLIPLSALTGSFGSDEDKVRQAYDQGLSAANFIVEVFGEEGMGRLLRAYKRGLADDEAFLEAFGLTVGDFEQAWLAWLGVPEGLYGTATPEPTADLPPMPTMMGLPTTVPSTTMVADNLEATDTPFPLTEGVEGTAVARAPAASPTEGESSPITGLCSSGALLAAFVLVPIQTKRRGKTA